MTPAQSRAARALLEWSQTELASRANLSESSIRDFEKGRRVLSPNNLLAIEVAFDRNGVTLLEDGERNEYAGEGARLTKMSGFGERRVIARRLSENIRDERVRLSWFSRILSLMSDGQEAKKFLVDEIESINGRIKNLKLEYEKLEIDESDL